MSDVALVHDYLLVMRGAERTFAAMADCWPAAPVYTLLYDPDEMGPRFAGHYVRPSYLQRLGIRQKGFRRLLPLFPGAVERLPVDGHSLVITSSSAFAHGVRPAPGAQQVCYCHSPFRYVWHERDRAISEVPAYARPAARLILRRARRWDLQAATRVTHYVANSEITRQRIGDIYGRESTVVHPPVEVERFRPGAPEDFFLLVGEVVRHKRVELALEAARRAGRAVKIVGMGPELERLRVQYGDTAEFLGRVGDQDLVELYARARALVVPNIEEFGIAAVEAQASGRPVVAADAGGARETVVDGRTGVLVPPGDVDALAEALRETDFDHFDSQHIAGHAQRFSAARFREHLTAEVSRLTGHDVRVNAR